MTRPRQPRPWPGARRRPWSGLLAFSWLLVATAGSSTDADYDAGVDSLALEIETRPGNAELQTRVARRRDELPADPAPNLREQLNAHDLEPIRIPGLFYERFPETGADLRVTERWLGGPVRRIPTDEVGTVEANAEVVASALRATSSRVVAISASKGSADLRAALENEPALGARVAIWLDLVGVLEGTPLLDAPAGDTAAQELGLPAPARRSLGGQRRRAAARPKRFPTDTRAVHVAAFPHARDITPRARSAFLALQPLGPNDGYVLLESYRRAPGNIFIVRGADHYLRLESIERTISALLSVLLEDLRPQTANDPWTSLSP
jgi:hypothetical protein